MQSLGNKERVGNGSLPQRKWPARTRHIISISVVLVYITTFLIVYPLINHGVFAGFSMLPGVIIGWLLGVRGGLVAGLSLTLMNMVLFTVLGEPALRFVFLGPGLIGTVFLIAFSWATGALSDTILKVRWQSSQLEHEQALLQREIGERKRVEAELRALLNAFPDTLFRMARDGTYLDVHAGNRNDLYVSQDAIIGSNITSILPEEMAAVCLAQIATALDSGHVQKFEYQLDVSTGKQDFEAHIARINDNEALAIVRNVTEQKEIEQRNLELAIERERVTILTELIDNLSHDFKTPLAVINTNIYLAGRANDINNIQWRMSQIQEQTSRLERYVEDILTSSRLNKEQIISLQPLNLSQLTQEAIDTLDILAQRKSITVQFQANGGTSLIMGNADNLSRALINLLDNALKYTPEGGNIQINMDCENGHKVIKITDTGIGIEDKHLPHIFERFYRCDPARNPNLGGTGLGLAIVKKIVEVHQGTIAVDSVVGEGTTFTLRLRMA